MRQSIPPTSSMASWAGVNAAGGTGGGRPDEAALLQALGEQAQALAVPPQHLDQVARRQRNTKAWPENGSRARWSWTRAASPSKPLRMSVCPVASQTREPDGTGIIEPSSAAIAPCRSARSAPTAARNGARQTARSQIRQARPGRHVGCRRDRGRQCERDEGRWGSRGLLLGQQGAPPSEQQLECNVPAGYLRGGRGGSSASARIGALLLGRPDAAGARNDDVRRFGHRSRHRADTAPSDARHCIQSKALQPQGGLHRALTEKGRAGSPSVSVTNPSGRCSAHDRHGEATDQDT